MIPVSPTRADIERRLKANGGFVNPTQAVADIRFLLAENAAMQNVIDIRMLDAQCDGERLSELHAEIRRLNAALARYEDMARRVKEWQKAHHRSVAAYEAMALHEDDPDKDGRAAYWRASEALAEITKALLALPALPVRTASA